MEALKEIIKYEPPELIAISLLDESAVGDSVDPWNEPNTPGGG